MVPDLLSTSTRNPAILMIIVPRMKTLCKTFFCAILHLSSTKPRTIISIQAHPGLARHRIQTRDIHASCSLLSREQVCYCGSRWWNHTCHSTSGSDSHIRPLVSRPFGSRSLWIPVPSVGLRTSSTGTTAGGWLGPERQPPYNWSDLRESLENLHNCRRIFCRKCLWRRE